MLAADEVAQHGLVAHRDPSSGRWNDDNDSTGIAA
jgi:hypothetical protein